MALKTLFQTALTDIKDTDIEGVGVLRYDDEGNIDRWEKNRNATAWTAKQPVCYDAGNVGTSALFKSANSPVAADLMLAAGIAHAAVEASGGACYGWVRVQGYFADARIRTPKTDTLEIGGEVVAVDAQTYLERQGDAGTAPIYSNHFIALEEVVSDGTGTAVVAKDVYVKCL
jgi:hypothetical protein